MPTINVREALTKYITLENWLYRYVCTIQPISKSHCIRNIEHIGDERLRITFGHFMTGNNIETVNVNIEDFEIWASKQI